jgi:hypothetical protein
MNEEDDDAASEDGAGSHRPAQRACGRQSRDGRGYVGRGCGVRPLDPRERGWDLVLRNVSLRHAIGGLDLGAGEDAHHTLDERQSARGGQGSKSLRQGSDVIIAFVAPLLQATHDDPLERLRDVGTKLSDRLGLGGLDQVEELVERVGRERRARREQLVEDGAERPDVGAVVDVSSRPHLLRRHVLRRPHDDVRRLEVGVRPARGLSHDLRDAKIEDLDHGQPAGPVGEKQVRWLQVAVHDAGAMGLGEGDASLEHELHGRVDRDGPAVQEAAQVRPFEVLHHDVREPCFRRTEVVDAGDVLTADHRGGTRLSQESLDGLRRQLGVAAEELDGDLLFERDVRRRHHDADASLPEDAVDPVLIRDDLARLEALADGFLFERTHVSRAPLSLPDLTERRSPQVQAHPWPKKSSCRS